MPIVVFSPATFKAQFPAFSGLTDDALNGYFARAGLLVNNTETSRVRDVSERGVLLNLLVAHFAQLSANQAAAGGGGTVVGRVSSASEGSVSVSFDVGPVTAANAWYLTTPYGAEYWMLTAKYRTLQVVHGRSLPARARVGWPWR